MIESLRSGFRYYNFIHSQLSFIVCGRHFSTMGDKKRALVLISAGSEEMETVITVDVLRRCGVHVTLAGIAGKEPVKCSRETVITPDSSLKEATSGPLHDAIIMPGGLAGSDAFAASSEVGAALKSHEEGGKLVAAICAAPIALKAHSIGLGKNITSYPGVKDKLASSYCYKEDRVVIDDKLITSRGPGTAFEFGIAVSKYLVGNEVAEEIWKAMLCK